MIQHTSQLSNNRGKPLLLLWGKWSGHAEPLPLLAHLLDTAAVALQAWDQYSPQVRQNAIDVLAPGCPLLACARFAVLAGLHDLGKASREFTGQAWSRQREEFAAHRESLIDAGLPMAVPKRPDVAAEERLWLRHEAATGLILHDLTGLPAWARRVVTGHHGRYARSKIANISRDLDDLHRRTAEKPWAAVQRELIDQVVAAVTAQTGQDAGLDGWPPSLPSRQVTFLFVLTGLVSVCDWIASDEVFTSKAPRDLLLVGDPKVYLAARMGHAHAALTEVGSESGTPVGDFATLFAGRTPRGDAQRWVAGRQHGPGLTMVMAPMGEGKTEVALHLHAHDASVPAGQPAGDGLFFGLPTMSTADAMFTRVQDFWSGTTGIGRLAHGQAVLNDFYAPSALRPTGICEHADGPGEAPPKRLHPEDWFSGRHRGLLAPVTVGTCDQVLAAALDHKYVQVRLAALAGKHVVLDEVHTYDPYQHELLCRLLGWLGAFRCRVTLLSATLPRVRVEQLARAWSAGWNVGSAQVVHTDLLAALPMTLPYPAVVTVGDTLVCQPLEAWRKFALTVRSHTPPAGKQEFLDATVALVSQLRAEHPQARIGLLVNNIDRAIGLYEALAPAEPGRSVLLHSRMAAAQRRDRTAKLHHLVGEGAPAGPVLVVATQVAEASLDLDLDLLVTDLAPMASILQRTGRLWRHSENTGAGWTHPPQLAYRTGDPVVHILAPVNEAGQVAAGFAALPYTTAELRRAWSQPDCLAGGTRTTFQIPEDLQPAIDAACLTFKELETEAGSEEENDDVQQLVKHLGAELAKIAAASGTGAPISAIGKSWRACDEADPWGDHDPDWSPRTAPVLWDREDGVVTRLQEQQQAQLLIWDPTGTTKWAWSGDPRTLLTGQVERTVLLRALDACVPVSGQLAGQLRDAAEPHLPPDWADLAPPLLRGLTPISVQALTALAVLHPKLGLIRQENPA